MADDRHDPFLHGDALLRARPAPLHARAHLRDPRAHELSLHRHSQGLPAAPGYRPPDRRSPGRPGRFLHGNEPPAKRGVGHHQQGQGRVGRRRRARRRHTQCDAERRASRRDAEAARQSHRHRRCDRRALGEGSLGGRRRDPLRRAGAGHPDHDTCQPLSIPIHLDRLRCGRDRPMGGSSRGPSAFGRHLPQHRA